MINNIYFLNIKYDFYFQKFNLNLNKILRS